MEQEIYATEFGPGRIISEAWQIYKKNFSRIVALTLLISLAQVALSAVASYAAGGSTFGLLAVLPASFLVVLASVWVSMAVAYLVKSRIDGQNPGFGESLGAVSGRLGPAILTSIIQVFLLIGLSLLLIIPGLIFAVYWNFSNYAVLFGGKSGMAALSESKSIVQGRWFKVFWRALAIAIMVIVASLIVQSMIGLVLPVETVVSGKVAVEKFSVSVALIHLANAFVTAFSYAALTVFFINFNATRKIEEQKPVNEPAAALPQA